MNKKKRQIPFVPPEDRQKLYLGVDKSTKSRQQELKECLRELFLYVDDKNGTLEVVNGFRVSDILKKAKELLNK